MAHFFNDVGCSYLAVSVKSAVY